MLLAPLCDPRQGFRSQAVRIAPTPRLVFQLMRQLHERLVGRLIAEGRLPDGELAGFPELLPRVVALELRSGGWPNPITGYLVLAKAPPGAVGDRCVLLFHVRALSTLPQTDFWRTIGFYEPFLAAWIKTSRANEMVIDLIVAVWVTHIYLGIWRLLYAGGNMADYEVHSV